MLRHRGEKKTTHPAGIRFGKWNNAAILPRPTEPGVMESEQHRSAERLA